MKKLAAVLFLSACLSPLAAHATFPDLKQRNTFDVTGIVVSVFDQDDPSPACPVGYERRVAKIFVFYPTPSVRSVILGDGVEAPGFQCIHAYGVLEPYCGGDDFTLPTVTSWSPSTVCPE